MRVPDPMLRQLTLPLAAALMALPLAAQAQSSGVAAGVNLGTPGIGAEAQLQLSEQWVVRGGVDWLRLGRDDDYGGVDYDAKLKGTTAGLFADFHPGGGPFLISGGAYLGERKLELDATPTQTVDIGGATFTPAQIGRIEGDAETAKVQPFLGLGYDNTFQGDRGWGFRALAGVSYSKKPDVNLTATGGTLSNTPEFVARLEAEEEDLREDADGFRWFPVLQVGFTRRF
jgi:hypothetical protein